MAAASKGKSSDKVIGLKLYESEKDAFEKLMERVHRKNPYANQSDVMRELLGFSNTGLITASDRALLLQIPVLDAPRAKDKPKK